MPFVQGPHAPPTALAARVGGLIRQGLAALQGRRRDEAERCFAAALAADPRHPDALQLMGLIAKERGRLDLAEDHMRRSLAVTPQQPHVHNNLANILSLTGRTAEAERHYREALRQKPDYAEAATGLARCLESAGKPADAEEVLRQILRRAPNAAAAWINLVVLLNHRQRHEEAASTARLGLARLPGNSKLLHNLGTALREVGDVDGAENSFKAALAADPMSKLTWLNLGNALASRDRHEEALEAYRRALAIDPRDLDATANLAKLLWQLDRKDAALETYRDLTRHAAGNPLVLSAAATGLTALGAADEGVRNAREAAERAPDDPQVHQNLGRILLQANRPADALIPMETAVRLRGNSEDLLTLSEAQLRCGKPDAAETTLQRLLGIDRHDQLGIALFATSRRLLGDLEGERRINDYRRCTAHKDLAAPAGWPDMDAFNRDLLAELVNLHKTVVEPIDQTLRHGTQTIERLFIAKGRGPAVRALRHLIESAVREFVDGLDTDPTHPFLGRKTENFRFTGSWSSRLHDRGFHTDHVHPQGWISGVYYVEVPDCAADDQAKQGWLKFGEPQVGPEVTLPWAEAVQPRPGRLVLFPSYVWHGTIPFHGPQFRTTVAFDIAPVG